MRRTLWVLVALVVALSMLFITTGCTRGSLAVGYGEPPPPPPPGPPPWAPAHGRRAKYVYHYYPDVAVYYYPVSSVYFYYSGGNWRVSASLPAYISVSGGYVQLEMDVDKPYIYHGDVKVRYPKGYKKKRKKYDDDDDDDERRGRGRKGYR